HLNDFVGHRPVGLAMHRGRRFLAGGVDQAEDLAGTLVIPVPDIVDAILTLYLEIFLVCTGCHLGGQSVYLVVHVEIERHRGLLLSHGIRQTREGYARWQDQDDREAPSSAHLAHPVLDRSQAPSALSKGSQSQITCRLSAAEQPCQVHGNFCSVVGHDGRRHTFLRPRYRQASSHIAPTPSNPSEKGAGVATLNLVFGAPKLPASAAVTPNDSKVPVGKYRLSSGGAFVSKTSSSSSPKWAASAECRMN